MIGKRIDGAAEGDQRDPIFRLQGIEDTCQRLLCLRDGIPLHRSRAIDHDGEIERARLVQARKERLKTRYRGNAFAVGAA